MIATAQAFFERADAAEKLLRAAEAATRRFLKGDEDESQARDAIEDETQARDAIEDETQARDAIEKALEANKETHALVVTLAITFPPIEETTAYEAAGHIFVRRASIVDDLKDAVDERYLDEEVLANHWREARFEQARFAGATNKQIWRARLLAWPGERAARSLLARVRS